MSRLSVGAMHDSIGDGIWKQNVLATPGIQSITPVQSTVHVQGTANADPGSSGNVLVELYKASGDGEGLQFVGSNYADGAGNWMIVVNGPAGCYTAFQTLISLPSGTRTSSKFATTVCAQPAQGDYLIFAPIVIRP